MSGRYIKIPEKPHECEFPQACGIPDTPPVGAIWLCNDCRTYWRYKYADSWGTVWTRCFWRNLFGKLGLHEVGV